MASKVGIRFDMQSAVCASIISMSNLSCCTCNKCGPDPTYRADLSRYLTAPLSSPSGEALDLIAGALQLLLLHQVAAYIAHSPCVGSIAPTGPVGHAQQVWAIVVPPS